MENVNKNSCSKTTVYVIAAIATFLLMAFLVNKMVKMTAPAPVGAERAAARAKDNAEIRGVGAEAAKSWGYVDQPRGIVRLPLEEAMKMTVQGYQKPDAFRTDLMARVEKANVPAPKPPEKKSEFE